MKIVSYICFVTTLTAPLYGQTVDYNKIILPENVTPATFEERLVQLAWKNHPSNNTKQQNVKIAQSEKQLAQWKWLDDIYASGNLNEYTINPSPLTPDNVFFPRYNFGFRFSIGTFVNTPLHTKVASTKILVAENEIKERKLLVREEVLSNFEKLKQFYKSLKLREQILEDYLVMYKDSEKKFSTGDIDIEKYRMAVQSYLGQAEKVVDAQASFNSTKITLDALIGLDLNELEGYKEFLQQLDSEIRID